MSISLALLVLFAALLHAGWNSVIKSGHHAGLSMGFIVLSSAFWASPFLIFLPTPVPESWPHLAASVLVHGLYMMWLWLGYRAGALNLVYPLARGVSPLIISLFSGYVLGEVMSFQAMLGIGFICFAIFAIGFTAIREASGRDELRAVLFALLTGSMIATYSTIDAMGVRLNPNPWSYALWLPFLCQVPFGWLMIYHYRKEFRDYWHAQGRRNFWAGAMATLNYSIILYCMTKAPAASVSALRETSVIFAALIGSFLLREPFGRTRFLAASVMAGGIAVLLLANGHTQ